MAQIARLIRPAGPKRAIRHFSHTPGRRLPAGADLYGAEFQAERAKVEEHAGHSAELWRKLTYYAAVPFIGVMCLHIYNIEKEHAAHKEHLIEENGGELPEKKVYPYMNVRKKDFPWGPESLFFNPHVNTPAHKEE